jgi:hypothetical protein
MEMFSAADEEQWKIIARHIEESDYYCVIVAHRYGSITGSVSYTQKEYEYAVQLGIPALGFVIDSSVSWPPEMVDKDESATTGLTNFKSLIKSKPVSFWKSTDDLYGKVSIALTKQITINPREGWIRANTSSVDSQVTNELSRLSAENSSLRNEIVAIQKSREEDRDSEARDMIADLRKHDGTFSYKYQSSDSTWKRATRNYLQLFAFLAPMLMSEADVRSLSDSLAMNIRENKNRSWWLVATNQIRDLLSDLMAFGLVEPSKRRHAVSDTGEYWTLTEFGQRVNLLTRRLLMEHRERVEPEIVDESIPTDGDKETTVAGYEEPEEVGVDDASGEEGTP